ncbi:prepilin-type N-terminal cleavage/methylation domain-containing protein [Telmatospirillum sp.]|uniref:prepilin-type N-terminal cleavage/methylation domain-containing protein n=1 Tax=Telmatospirillum sp. TaxID=2079197 RepID=UPI00283CB34C|nr:prepilin-type N-terminal cleavage/methylation domain-containing protein [Telmatospirillum sp.]MDR3436841.1 prepilin-type N-terminal cleavage/methylation domain-containing protein [Telmatospirillum sp.]
MTLSCETGRRRYGNRRRAGFTLLEVLVALAIAGLALAVMTDAATGGFLATKTAAGYQEAVSRAKSHLAALAADAAFSPAEAEGDDGGGFHWRTRITEKARQNPDKGGGLGLYDIEVGISWTAGGRQREVVLKTERVGQALAEHHE